jgi:hypothetical protein
VYGGQWRLSSRSVVYDWSRSHTPTEQDRRRSHD